MILTVRAQLIHLIQAIVVLMALAAENQVDLEPGLIGNLKNITMGITQLSLDRLRRQPEYGNRPLVMAEMGAQNMYDQEHYNMIAKDYFEQQGIDHHSFDINPHQGANELDLRKPLPKEMMAFFDIVTDFGTTEHVSGNYYQACKNLHDMCNIGGLIIRENPKTGNWPGHGSNYVTQGFYTQLAKQQGYETIELTEEPAMGNVTDGWNVCCVLRKVNDNPFIRKEEFEKLDYRKS